MKGRQKVIADNDADDLDRSMQLSESSSTPRLPENERRLLSKRSDMIKELEKLKNVNYVLTLKLDVKTVWKTTQWGSSEEWKFEKQAMQNLIKLGVVEPSVCSRSRTMSSCGTKKELIVQPMILQDQSI